MNPSDRLKAFKRRAKSMDAPGRAEALTSEDFRRLVDDAVCFARAEAECGSHCRGHCRSHCVRHH